MALQEPPKIEFPCENYPIKVMGETSAAFFDFVLSTTETFAPNFDRTKVLLKESGKGRFTSVTVFITATGVEQLEQYHQALKENTATKVVL
ncbi:MAG: putative lipoic acid-binding regulatory protein [Kiritimatiellia bacterium]|jgi:putative lipoic acid-binding regulatory protein